MKYYSGVYKSHFKAGPKYDRLKLTARLLTVSSNLLFHEEIIILLHLLQFELNGLSSSSRFHSGSWWSHHSPHPAWLSDTHIDLRCVWCYTDKGLPNKSQSYLSNKHPNPCNTNIFQEPDMYLCNVKRNSFPFIYIYSFLFVVSVKIHTSSLVCEKWV